MEKINLFTSTLYPFQKKDWLDKLNTLTNPIINNLKNKTKDKFGHIYHSENLNKNNNFEFIYKHILKQANNILTLQGFDLKNHKLNITSFWVQEFSSLGGSHHSLHTHYDSHISGFYFLKCNQNTSFPIFEDPRNGALMNKLPEKNNKNITDASSQIHIKFNPGSGVFFNSYLPHQFTVDNGREPFRFIHWNIQAVPKEKEMAKDV